MNRTVLALGSALALLVATASADALRIIHCLGEGINCAEGKSAAEPPLDLRAACVVAGGSVRGLVNVPRGIHARRCAGR